MTDATKKTIEKLTEAVCKRAYNMHTECNLSAFSIGVMLDITTRQANAAIKAGQEICVHEAAAKQG